MSADRPVLGIVLMLAFCIVAPMGDAVAKILGQSVSVGQIVLVRFALQAAMLAPLIILTRRAWRMRGRVLWLTLVRTVLHIAGIAMMVSALRYLPLADAVAIAFVMPFIMLVLGHYLLNEYVGPRRILASAAGFAGTLLVVQPSFAEVGWPALLPVGVAVNFAVFMLITRQIAKETDPIGLQAVSGGMAVAMMAPLLWLTRDAGIAPLGVVIGTAMDWILMLSIGVIGTVAHLFMTWALRYAPAATLAPMQYLEIPFATLIGLIVFGDLPNPVAGLGILITIGAGLYVVLRERAIARKVATPRGSVHPAE
ncbi:DMT family transporter [Sulfitobacter sp. LCG007]